jgi:hypothetical protein
MAAKAPMMGDRHRGGGDQHGAPVLQEHQDDHQHQDRRLVQGLVDLMDRVLDEDRGVEWDRRGERRWEFLGQHRQALAHLRCHVEGVRAGRLEDRQARGRLAVEREDLAVGLRAELDAGDVAQPRHLAGAPGLDDHGAELLGVAELAHDVQRVLKRLALRRRWRADLPGGDLLALLLQRVDHVLRHQIARLHLARIEPHPHGVLAGAEHGHAADAGQPRDLVLELDRRVIGEIEAVVAPVGRGQGDDLQDRGRVLLHDHALRLHRLRQLRYRARHPVLHQHLRQIEIDADLERHGERVAAVGAAVGLHVDHALDAVDLLLDRQRHGIDDGTRARAGIARGDLHGGRHHVGILRDRQREHGDAADHHHQDGEHIGENRPRDEEIGDHARAPAGYFAPAPAGGGPGDAGGGAAGAAMVSS